MKIEHIEQDPAARVATVLANKAVQCLLARNARVAHGLDSAASAGALGAYVNAIDVAAYETQDLATAKKLWRLVDGLNRAELATRGAL